MKSKLIPIAKESDLIHESGVQRRLYEPDLELDSRVSINSATRILTTKADDIAHLKSLEGRPNDTSPRGGLVNVLTNQINVIAGCLWRMPFSGTIAPSWINVSDPNAIKEGYVLFENTSVTNASISFGAYEKNFPGVITLASGEGFLVRYTLLRGHVLLKKVSLYEAVAFPRGQHGALVVNTGQTLNLAAGEVYDYSSIDIKTGGTLNIDATITAELTQIYCTGNFICNGQIIGKRIGNAGTFSKATAVGETVAFTVAQSLGGSGQNGNSGTGGTGANGFGGGGGGGAYSAPGGRGGSGGAAGGGGAYGTRAPGGYGGNGNWTLGNGETNRGVTVHEDGGANGGHGGGSGGGGGGGGSERKHSGDSPGGNSGSGGGYKGKHGIGLYLYILGTVTGSGKIDLKGTNGYNGGANVNYGRNGYGGAGGGGAGGSGGHLIVRDVGNAFGNNAATTVQANKIHVDIGFGTGGIGGTRNYGPGGKAQDGQSGTTGTYTRQGIV